MDAFRRKRRLGFVVLTLYVIACSGSVEPQPSNSQQYSSPPVYQLWWGMVEACSGRSAPLGDVKWYIVPGADSLSDGHDEVAGYWSSSDNHIVLIQSGKFNGPLVRHEMLHALVRVNGHPLKDFIERCGGIVDCRVVCAQDAGAPPAPDSSVPRVSPDSLRLGIEIQPQTPDVNLYDGYFTVAVTATNPASHAIVVPLQPSGSSDPSVSFTCFIQGPGSNLQFTSWAWDQEDTYFAAGETKRHVFDLALGTPTGVAGIGFGTFHVRSQFGGGGTTIDTLVLAP